VPNAVDTELALARVRAYAGEMLEAAGLPELCSLVGHEPAGPVAAPEPLAAPVPVRRRRSPTRSGRHSSPKTLNLSTNATESAAAAAAAGDADGTYDYVGIVMAKSAEGDAVAAILAERDDIEVHEQQAFWDIRARDRLVIPYDEVSEQLGYEIDAYSIQHEMSTHYGRMVAADDALMLFSDPTEAMQYLMS
jgi:propane monooxygenase coupling protein